MSSIEDRLRDAYQEAAATVPPAGLRGVPAADPTPGPARRLITPRQHPTPRRRRLLAPVAAAAAVTAIAVAAVAVPQVLPHHGGGVTSAGPARPARFFLAAAGHGALGVYSVATGRRTGEFMPVDPHTTLGAAAATGKDQAFILAETSTAACGSTQLLSVWVSGAGKPQSIGSIPVSGSGLLPRIAGSVTALASSADGRTIAYASALCGQGAQMPGVIGVVHTGGGQSRHWGWNSSPGQAVGSLSITADGKMIEYAASPNKISGPGEGQVLPVREIRLLPADAPPGTAAQRSRVAVTVRTAAPGSEFTSGLIAPGGQTVYFCTERGQFSPHPAETLRAYDVASGTTSVLRSLGRTRGQGCLLGASASDLLIVRDITKTPSRVDRLNLRTGRLAPVPVRQAVDESSSSVPW